MSLTFKEALERLETSKQERAVWNELADFLMCCIDSEVKETTKAIAADGCVSKTVPQDIIRSVVQIVEEEKITPLDETIASLESLQVGENKNAKKGKETKGKTTKKSGVKKSRGVRVVARGPKTSNRQVG